MLWPRERPHLWCLWAKCFRCAASALVRIALNFWPRTGTKHFQILSGSWTETAETVWPIKISDVQNFCDDIHPTPSHVRLTRSHDYDTLHNSGDYPAIRCGKGGIQPQWWSKVTFYNWNLTCPNLRCICNLCTGSGSMTADRLSQISIRNFWV